MCLSFFGWVLLWKEFSSVVQMLSLHSLVLDAATGFGNLAIMISFLDLFLGYQGLNLVLLAPMHMALIIGQMLFTVQICLALHSNPTGPPWDDEMQRTFIYFTIEWIGALIGLGIAALCVFMVPGCVLVFCIHF
jgi:hypothetical protein